MGYPEDYAARLEAEADEILAKLNPVAKQNQVEQNNNQAEPYTDSSAEKEQTPAPAQTDSQAGNESGDSEPESELDAKIRLAEERVRNTQARMHKATQEAAELRKYSARLEERLAELEAKVQAADEPDTKSLEEDYPDIAKPLLAKLSKLERQLNETQNSFQQKAEFSEREAHFEKIRASHPDFDEVAQSEDFQGWLERQTPVWKKVSQNGTADEVVELLSRFKEVLSPRPSDRAKALAEPAMPKARRTNTNGESSKKVWSRDEINRLSLAEWAKLEDEIDKAMLEGRIR